MTYGVGMTRDVHEQLLNHLLRRDRQEDACFALWHPSAGKQRLSAIIASTIAPEPGDREVHGNVAILPQYISRAISTAVAQGCGLALLHSHLGPGWQDMSSDDIETEAMLGPRVLGATRLPLVGLTAGTDGSWSARFWLRTAPKRYERKWCESVRVVGSGLHITFHDGLLPPPGYRQELDRTVSAWGTHAQGNLSRLRVGVVGLGSVGSMVADALARMGVQRLVLLDFDAVEAVNLDRHMHATRADIGKAKVHVSARQLQLRATAAHFSVTPLELSIVEPDGFRAALDCDVLFSCVDNRPWSRQALNALAHAHLIPVIDGGVDAEPLSNGRGLRRADVRGHVVMPGSCCLECLGQYDSGLVALDQAGLIDSESYIRSLPREHGLRRNENVYAFSMMAAALEVRQLLAMVVMPHCANPQAMYHFVTGGLDRADDRCRDGCYFVGITGLGDHCHEVFTGPHAVAEQCRLARRRARGLGSMALLHQIGKLFGRRS